MFWNLSSHEKLDILLAIHKAVVGALSNTSKSEPQLIANLVRELPDALNSVPLAGGYSLETGGIFVHAQPLVTCKGFPDPTPKSVELGDLLLIRTGIQNGKILERRALLLQAKKASRIPTKPDNANQHHLYANWPSFKYVRSGPELNGKSRHIKGPNLYSGAKYFLIGDDPVKGCCHHPILHLLCPHDDCQLWLAEPSHPDLSVYRCFYLELLDFIIGNTGRSFMMPPPKRTRGWDRVIKDLLKQTSKKISAYTRRSKTKGGLRGHGVLELSGVLKRMSTLAVFSPELAAMTDTMTINDASDNIPPDNEDDGHGNEDDDGGISIIEIVASSESDKNE